MTKITEAFDAYIAKGGPGSGDFGHAGREGERGGSGAGGGAAAGLRQELRGNLVNIQAEIHLRDAGVLKANGELKSGLGRRHFEAVASGIKARGGSEEVARAAASRLSGSNALFNTERFVNAATGKGSTTPGRLGHTKETAEGIRQAAQASRDRLREERAAGLINIDLRRKTGIADVLKDFSVGDGLQDYNLGPGQKRPKRKGKNTKRTSFEQFPRDYVARDKTGIADVVKYTADQKRERGKYVGGSADARMRSGAYRRGILPGMHYHGNQTHVHPNGDTSHGHKPGGM